MQRDSKSATSLSDWLSKPSCHTGFDNACFQGRQEGERPTTTLSINRQTLLFIDNLLPNFAVLG